MTAAPEKPQKATPPQASSQASQAPSQAQSASSAPADPKAKGGKSAKAERRAAKVAARGTDQPKDIPRKDAPRKDTPKKDTPKKDTAPGASAAAATSAPLSTEPVAPWLKQQLFVHLDGPSTSQSLAKSIRQSQAAIHPSIARLAIQNAEFSITGANVRCVAMLEAFKEVIRSYTPPPQAVLVRHLPSYLSPQINHLVRARPLSVSMGNAIRYVKSEIGNIPPECPDDKAKAHLIERIDTFIQERIVLANEIIQQLGITKIKDGDVILTFGESVTVEQICVEAYRRGTRFRVIVVDSSPLYEAKSTFDAMSSAGVPCTYVLLPHISLLLPDVTLGLISARALLSNGAIFSRAGTAMVAMALKKRGCPVVCCCETYKFTERIMLDSIVGNEITSLPLDTDLDDAPSISALHLLYDVSRPEDLTAIITEAGIIAVEAVPVVLRDYKPLIQGASVL